MSTSEGTYRESALRAPKPSVHSCVVVGGLGAKILAVSATLVAISLFSGSFGSILICERRAGSASCELRSQRASNPSVERFDGAVVDVVDSATAKLPRHALYKRGARWELTLAARRNAGSPRTERAQRCGSQFDDDQARAFFRGEGASSLSLVVNQPHHRTGMLGVVGILGFALGLFVLVRDVLGVRRVRYDRERRRLSVRSLTRTLFDRELRDDETACVEHESLLIRGGDSKALRERVEGTFTDETHSWLRAAQHPSGRPAREHPNIATWVMLAVALCASAWSVRLGEQRPVPRSAATECDGEPR